MNICELIDNNDYNDENSDDKNKEECGIGSLTDEDVGESNDACGNNQQNFDEYFDGLSILEKFFRLCEAQKFDIAIKYILAALESCSVDDDFMRIFAILRNSCFYNDIIIRSMWIEQIPNVIQYFQHKQMLTEDIKTELSIIISNLMQYTSYQVRKIASAALLTLIERNLIEINKIELYIIPCLLNLVNENNDDIHIECVSTGIRQQISLTGDIVLVEQINQIYPLFGKFAPLLGRDLTVKHLLIPFCRLCSSPIFHTRKVCATNIGDIAVVISNKEVEEFLLPHFSEFTKDQVWAIRKVCAEIFSTFANKCSREIRETILTECFIHLLEDNSCWVKISAYKALGSFIATFFKTEDDYNNKSQANNETFILNENEQSNSSIASLNDEEAHTALKEAENKLDQVHSSKTYDQLHETSNKLIDQNNIVEDDLSQQINYSQFLYWRDTLPDIPLIEDDEERPTNVAKTENLESVHQYDDDYSSRKSLGCKNDESYVIYTDYNNGSYMNRYSSSSANNYSINQDLNTTLNNQLQEQNIVPPRLLSYFITMVDMNAQISLDSEMNYNCAFNFPAIAYTLGACYWKYLRDLYKKLAEDVNWKVRQTLAYSIHEFAHILGMEITQNDLVPIFDSYIKDVDEVRIGIVTNLSKFLMVLDDDYRRSYLSKLTEFFKMDNQRNWRFRNELALQIFEISELYSSDNVSKFIQPIAFTLALDKVAEVRATAIKALTYILKQYVVKNELHLRSSFVDDALRTLANNERWSIRQLFIALCSNILAEKADNLKLFSEDLLPHLLMLREDKVANIRLCLARFLAQTLLLDDYFILETNVYENQIQPTIQCLRGDSDNDVKSYFAEITEQEDLSNPNDSSEDNKLKDNDIVQIICQVTTCEQTNVES